MPDDVFFQWQNPFLLSTIYPMRATKLCDFLVYFQEIDLWAQYQGKSDAEIEAIAQQYRKAMTAKWEQAFGEYHSLRQYFLNPDVSASYQALFPDPDPEVLKAILDLHKLFATYLPRIKSFTNEGYFIASRIAEWENIRKAFLASIQQKQRRIDVRRPDWPDRPRVEREIQQMKESGIPMADQELDRLLAFQRAFTCIEKEKKEMAKLIRLRDDQATQARIAEQKLHQLKARATTTTQELEAANQEYLRLKRDLDILEQVLSLPESAQMKYIIAQRPVTRKDIVCDLIDEYQKARKVMNEDALLEEVVCRFMAEPARYPLWLQYMVIHFSGMRYKSAHGSWANPIDLLIALRARGIEQKIRSLDDISMDLLCKEKQALYTEEANPAADTPPRPALSQTTDDYWRQRIAMRLKGLASLNPYQRRRSLTALLIDEVTYEFNQLGVEQAEHQLAVMSEALPEWMWKEIVRLSSLKLHAVNAADWEIPTSAEQAERGDRQYRSYRQIMDVWKEKDITGWREEHGRRHRLIVTRAVCNEVAEHIQHLRGHLPSAGLTNKPLWYQRLERNQKLAAMPDPPYFVRAGKAENFKPGASILWLNFTRSKPNRWQIADRIRLQNGEELLPANVMESGKYERNPDGHILRAMDIINEKGDKKRIKEWMRWSHEATVAVVAETADGTTVLTFETALPSEPRSRSTMGVFKHLLGDLFFWENYPYFNGVFVGYVSPAEPPLEDLKEMLDWNKILRRQAYSPEEIQAYWDQVIVAANLTPHPDTARPA